MTLPVELSTSQTIAALRMDHDPHHEEDALHLVKGAYFSWDAGKGDVSLDVRPELGALLHVSAQVHKVPDWLTFNIDMGSGEIGVGDILGLVVEFEGCSGDTLPMFIRSARDGALSDTWLSEPLTGAETRTVRAVFHQVRPEDPVAAGPAYHTLVLPLPKRDFELELRDMRFFLVPAARGLRLGAPTLSET